MKTFPKAKDLFGKVYLETVTEKFGCRILASDLKKATLKEIQISIGLAKKGKCHHNIVQDEDCWPYAVRSCAVCGLGLGLI